MKQCSTCEEVKPREDFYKASHTKDGLRSKCKACILIRQAEYYQKNKDKCKAYNKKHYADNKEHYQAYRKLYYADNKDKLLEYSKQYYADNMEYFKAYHGEYAPKYYKERIHYYKMHRANNTAKELGVSGRITDQDVIDVFTDYNNQCALCGTTEDLCLEHKKPMVLGGTNTKDNLGVLCFMCNSEKGETYIEYEPYKEVA